MTIKTTYEVAMAVLGTAEMRCAEWKAGNSGCFKCPMKLPGAGCAVRDFKKAADKAVPKGYWEATARGALRRG